MSSTIPDLWPADLAEVNLVPPVSILRRQAAILAEKTNGLLEGRVDVRGTTPTFSFDFDIVAPSLDNYYYTLFKVQHDINLYPVTVEATSISYVAEDMDEFLEVLRRIFSDDKTRRITNSLIAQTKIGDS